MRVDTKGRKYKTVTQLRIEGHREQAPQPKIFIGYKILDTNTIVYTIGAFRI